MSTPQKQGELQPQLHKIVTRDGKSHRIPETLEAELDDLEALFSTLIQQVEAGLPGEMEAEAYDHEPVMMYQKGFNKARGDTIRVLARLRERWGCDGKLVGSNSPRKEKES